MSINEKKTYLKNDFDECVRVLGESEETIHLSAAAVQAAPANEFLGRDVQWPSRTISTARDDRPRRCRQIIEYSGK